MSLLLALIARPLPPEPEQPAQAGGVGVLRPHRPGRQTAPWQWVPFTPVKTRPRKKRQADLLFLGN